MIKVITFGCRLNIYESEIIKKCAIDAGLDKGDGVCGNVVIINSCAVTAEAQRQVKQAIRKYRHDDPHAKIIVTGCAVEIAFDQFTNMPEVDAVIGNNDKLSTNAYLAVLSGGELTCHIQNFKDCEQNTKKRIIHGFEGKARAFVQVQGGCNHFCSYCVIPYTRGRSYSISPKNVIEQVKILIDEGYRELVITGVDIASYGLDLDQKISLAGLINMIFDHCPRLFRLRVSSIDPAACDSELVSLLGSDSRIAPHVHLSIQSGNDTVLSRMRRRHSRDDVKRLCENLRNLRSDIAIGSDFITGFPGEDDNMFQDTCDLVKEVDLTFLHVFPYSLRPKTEAAKFVQLPNARQVAKNRAKILRELGDQQLEKHLSKFIGNQVNALVEKGNQAKSDHFMTVEIDKHLPEASLVRADVWKADQKRLFANVVEIIK